MRSSVTKITCMFMCQRSNPCGGCGSCSDCLLVERKARLTAIDYAEWRPGGLFDSLRECGVWKAKYSREDVASLVQSGVIGGNQAEEMLRENK